MNFNELEEIITKYSSKKIPLYWWVNPNNKFKNNQLEDYLIKKGFTEQFSQPHMALHVSEELINKIKAEKSILDIKLVETTSEMNTYIELVNKGFSFPESLTKAFEELYTNFFLKLKMYQEGLSKLFVGLKDKKPVCTGNLIYGAGVAGLYSIAVLPEYRGKGYGKYITKRMISEAFEKGYKTCILQASGMGYPLYEKLGFKTYYEAKCFLLA